MVRAERGRKPSRRDAGRYLARVLGMNPLREAEAIVERRNRFLGLAGPGDGSGEGAEVMQRRDEARRAIESLRETFWSSELETLKQRLDGLELAVFPELQAAAERLRTVLAHRPAFPRLPAHPASDAELFDALKQLVVLPPREAAPLRERLLRMTASPRRRKRFQKMVKMIRREFPEIHALECDWFDEIAKAKQPKLVDGRTRESRFSIDTEGVPWWIYSLIIFAILMLIRTLGR
ncbi:MAG: FUSC family protein [Planctomycetes bacterium]|nr:FUSC family protein [Planctomycetota bacterium]